MATTNKRTSWYHTRRCSCGIGLAVITTLWLLQPTVGFAISRPALEQCCILKDNDLCHNPQIPKTRQQKKIKKEGIHFSFLCAQNGNNLNEDDIRLQEQFRSKTIARVGGRKPKVNKSPRDSSSSNRIGDIFRQWALPLFFSALVMRFLFGGIFSSSSNYVYYYSRSVYQSTTYSRDGNVETKRKETFQSNVPGLVERSRDVGKNVISIDDEMSDLENEIFDAFNIKSW
eukprot:scaffold29754_cov67-Cyclotella_meneghiniana.AAC.2